MVESSSTSEDQLLSSKWKLKLDKKLRGLADSASKDSILTVSIYIGYNRKYSNVIAKSLFDVLTTTTTTAATNNQQRQWLFWQVIHELLLANHTNPTKYDKYLDLRTTLGDITVIPAIKSLGNNVLKDKLEPLLKEWDEHNVFSSPTLVTQIRRMLVSSASSTATATATTKAEESTSKEDSAMTPVDTSTTTATTATEATTSSSKVENNKADDDSSKPAAAAAAAAATSTTTHDAPPSTPTTTRTINNENNTLISQPFDINKAQRRRSSLGSLSGDIEYDFDSKNVPKGKVDSREFLDPCKAIATLQIARDLRNDTAVQLSSLMTTLPKDIEEACKDHTSETTELSKETIHDYSMRIPSKLLDLDMNEQIQTIQTFQELIRQQMTAREKLIHLLLKSRCHFGSEPAAKYFGDLQTMMDQLQRRKSLLGDALELEGLDNELDSTDFDKEIQALQPLSWYKGGNATTTTGEADDDGKSNNKNEGSSNKKPRLN